MKDKLYQYLLSKKKLPLPGVGTLVLDRQPANIDIINKQANPPSYSISLSEKQEEPGKEFFEWLASAMNSTTEKADQGFQQFAQKIDADTRDGKEYNWEGVGVIKKQDGSLLFDSFMNDYAEGPVVPAVKVLRNNASHTVRVGEQEKTSTEMREMLASTAIHRSYAWVIWVLLIAALLTAAYFFTTKGTGNFQKISPQEELPNKR